MQSSALEVLADPTRRRIVEALRHGERPVHELVEATDIHQSGVSRHLRILLEGGFVTVRAEGQRRYYALRPEPFRELDAWVAQYRRLWDGGLDRFGRELDRRNRARTRARAGGREGS